MTELGSVEGDRDLLEVLVEEYLARHRRGEAESIEEFVERSAENHPTEAARIREELPGPIKAALVLESVVAEPRPGDPLLKPGQLIRHYRVERHIGSGGMGEVYLARNRELDTSVAIKLLSPRYSSDLQLSAAFKREGRTAAKLDHRNVARVRDSFEHDGRNYLVMEFVEGQSLGDLTKGGKPVPTEELLDVGIQIAQGLAAAHSLGIIHRDLKPHNVMITADGRVKILDFGLAKVDQARNPTSRDVGSSIFPSGVVVGTIGYMSPEQVCGQHVDARSDLFALGVVFYEMATGVVPFRRSTFGDTQNAILKEKPKPATVLNPEIPFELARLIDKLLAKEPEDRYQSSEAVLKDLEALRSPPTTGKQPLLTKVLWVSMVLALSALLYFWLKSPDEDPRIAEITELVSAENVTLEDLLGANHLLGKLERDLGKNKQGLVAPRELVRLRIAKELGGFLEDLKADLADGESVDAEQLERVKELDADVWNTANLMSEDAARLGKNVEATCDEVKRLLNDRRLAQAWEKTKDNLDNRKFKGKEFKPAADSAKQLRERLSRILVDRLEEPGESEVEQFGDDLTLLERVDPDHQDIERFRKALAERERKKKLRELAEDALEIGEPGTVWNRRDEVANDIVGELEKLHWQAGNIDPQGQSDERQKVKKLLDTWRFAGRVSDEFAKGQPFPEELLRDAPNTVATDDASPVGAADAWLKSFAQARGDVAHDPESARAAVSDLKRRELAPRFQDAATELIRNLEVEIESAAADAQKQKLIAQARELVEATRERSRKLQPPTAKQEEELETLRSKPELEGLDLLFEPVEKIRDSLKKQQAEADSREEQYARLRTALRSPDAAAGVVEGLKALERGWRREKRSLDRAIVHSPKVGFESKELESVNEELLWRRAVLNLRLLEYRDALEDLRDAKRGESPERLLLSGMAEFGRGRLDDARRVFERAAGAKASGMRPRALYWLGTVANIKEREKAALDYFEQAIESGVDYADAYHQVAMLHLRKESFSEAIDSAKKCLASRSAFSEDEMLVLFAGEGTGEYPVKAAAFVYDALLICADAHLEEDSIRFCIKDSTDAIAMQKGRPEAYYRRALAHYTAKEFKPAGDDCDRTIERAADGSEIKKLAQELKERIPR